MTDTEQMQTQEVMLKAWETPRLETLELASTEGGRKPDTKETGSKFPAS